MKWSDVHWVLAGVGLGWWLVGVTANATYFIAMGGTLSLLNGAVALWLQGKEEGP